MSNNPPYPPPPGSGQPPYGPPGGQQPPPYGAPGGQPAYGQPQPAYGAPYGPPGSPGFGAPPATGKRWYQRWWVWLLIVIGIAVIAIVIVAIVNGNKYALESKIKDEAKKDNITLTNLSCPNNINTSRGHTYDCTATLNGTPSTLHITFVQDRKFTIRVGQ
jgi:hypothetical protein